MNNVPYRIDIPTKWNGGLVMYAHGYSIAPQKPHSTMAAPLLAEFLQRGFAVAASDFRVSSGWATGDGIADTEALRRHFVSRYGRPRQTYMLGLSLGTLVAIASMEQFGAHYDGALATCGPLVPALDFGGGDFFDRLVAFEYLFPDAMPAGAKGLDDPRADSALTPARLIAAAAKAPDKVALFAQRFNLQLRDVGPTVAFYYIILKDLQRRAGGHPFDNTGTIYRGFGNDTAMNRGVRRYSAAPSAVAYVRRNYTTTGRITKPVLAVHGTYDPVVPPATINRYRALTDAAGTSPFFQSAFAVADTHCNFGWPVYGAAFDALRRWVETGTRPVGGEVTAQGLRLGGPNP